METCKNCRYCRYYPEERDDEGHVETEAHYHCELLYRIVKAQESCPNFESVPALEIGNSAAKCGHCRHLELDDKRQIGGGLFSSDKILYYCHARREYVEDKNYCSFYSVTGTLRWANTGFFNNNDVDQCRNCR